MLKKLRSSILVAFGIVTLTTACSGPLAPRPTTIVFTAQLSAANEVPPVTNADATGSGTATITIHDITYRANGESIAGIVDFQVSLTGFPLLTQVSAAHIHSGGVGVAGAVYLDTGLSGAGGLTLTTGAGTISRTAIALDGDKIDAIKNNPASFYFNVHTTLNGAGAVRGQLVKQ